MPPSPAHIVTQVHDAIAGQFLGQKSFETLCYARFDSRARQIDYVDCGYTPTVHYRKADETCTLLRGDNMPLGFSQNENYRQLSLPFAPGDQFLFYSDGITNAQSEMGEAFGSSRLLDLVKEWGGGSPDELITRIQAAVLEFAESPISEHLACIAVRIAE